MPSSKRAVVSHIIDAARSEVFDAWVVPELLETWWGPDDLRTVVLELEASQGRRFRFEMTSPSGATCQMTGFYREVRCPSLLVLEVIDHCNLDLPEGAEPQLEPALVTVELLERGDRTEVVVTHAPLDPTYSELAAASWSDGLRKLSAGVGAGL